MIIQVQDETESLTIQDNPALQQLPEAIKIGTVRIDSIAEMRATIITPPDFKSFTEEDHLLQSQIAAIQIGIALESIGFQVTYSTNR